MARISSSLLQECIDHAHLRPVVISAEDFWRCDPQDIKSHLEVAYIGIFDVRVVYAERPFCEWIFSLYRSNLHQLRGISFHEWFHNVILEISYMRSKGEHSIYDPSRLAKWSDCFGELQRLVFPFSEPLVDIAKIANVEQIPWEWEGLCLHVNRSNNDHDRPSLCSDQSCDADLASGIADNLASLAASNSLSDIHEQLELSRASMIDYIMSSFS